MHETLKEKLIPIVKEKIVTNDFSHDWGHISRVLAISERIGREEKADFDIVVPAALLHDVIVYSKEDPRSEFEEDESADYAQTILKGIDGYAVEKIEKVSLAIRQNSFLKGIVPDFLEAKILQDADRLEATGAISIMRTFTSGGHMNIPLYRPDDPFCENRDPEPLIYSLDLFYARLLKVQDTMHTDTAKRLAKDRKNFLEEFLSQLRKEILIV